VSLDPSPNPVAEKVPVGRLGFAWIVVLVLYSAARALVVAPTLGPYGVNPWVFLALDVGCAFPLASGQVSLVQGLRRRNAAMVQRSMALVAASFLAPYLYLLLGAARPLPAAVYTVVGALVVGMGAATVWKVRSEAARAREAARAAAFAE
jgi:hypothetical protein